LFALLGLYLYVSFVSITFVIGGHISDVCHFDAVHLTQTL